MVTEGLESYGLVQVPKNAAPTSPFSMPACSRARSAAPTASVTVSSLGSRTAFSVSLRTFLTRARDVFCQTRLISSTLILLNGIHEPYPTMPVTRLDLLNGFV